MKYILLILAVTTCSVLSIKQNKENTIDPNQQEIDALDELLSR